MNVNYINILVNFLKVSFLLSIVLLSVFIAQNAALIDQPLIASAVTFDLIITLPLAYWVFIRKTKISKKTIATLILFGFVLASLILPENNRQFLDILKVSALPLLEFGLLIYVGFVFYKARNKYKTLGIIHEDFLAKLRETLSTEFPNKFLGKAISFEIAGIYYAFFKWRKARNENNFTYHKQNGTAALLSVFMFLIAVETIVFHFLIAKMSVTGAWILTALSIYFLFQIFAHLKAIFFRPIQFSDDKLMIRCGLLGDAEIDLRNIESVEIVPANFDGEEETVFLLPLGKFTPCNLSLILRNEAILHGVYGKSKKFRTICLSIDEAEKFKVEVEKFL